MRRTLTMPFALLLAACGGSDGTGPNETTSIAGNWTFSDQISAASVGISCTSAGTATIAQSGSTFTGNVNATQGLCTDSFGNTLDNSGTNAVSGGQINGNQVTFQVPFCQFTGTISGSPANQMSGTETCTIAVSGQSVTFTGTWQASR